MTSHTFSNSHYHLKFERSSPGKNQHIACCFWMALNVLLVLSKLKIKFRQYGRVVRVVSLCRWKVHSYRHVTDCPPRATVTNHFTLYWLNAIQMHSLEVIKQKKKGWHSFWKFKVGIPLSSQFWKAVYIAWLLAPLTCTAALLSSLALILALTCATSC